MQKKAVDTCKFELTGGNIKKKIKLAKFMKKFLEMYLMPNFPERSDSKFRFSLQTVKLTWLSSEMDKKCYEK